MIQYTIVLTVYTIRIIRFCYYSKFKITKNMRAQMIYAETTYCLFIRLISWRLVWMRCFGSNVEALATSTRTLRERRQEEMDL